MLSVAVFTSTWCLWNNYEVYGFITPYNSQSRLLKEFFKISNSWRVSIRETRWLWNVLEFFRNSSTIPLSSVLLWKFSDRSSWQSASGALYYILLHFVFGIFQLFRSEFGQWSRRQWNSLKDSSWNSDQNSAHKRSWLNLGNGDLMIMNVFIFWGLCTSFCCRGAVK